MLNTKIDADGKVERYKAILVACGKEQLFGVDYTLTFAVLIGARECHGQFGPLTQMERAIATW